MTLLILLAGLAIVIPLSSGEGNDDTRHRRCADISRPLTTADQALLPDIGITQVSA
jgi:hypothetical protein